MKKFYILISCLVSLATFGQDLIITGVFDGPLPGGEPKAVELYVLNDISDLALYGIGSANNGGGTDGQEATFNGTATAGDYLYVVQDDATFFSYFGFGPEFVGGSALSINGDDAIELYYNGSVIDTFGDINVDGSGTGWDYLDGWAYRVDGSGPDGTSFVESNWTYSGINVLDGCTDNASCSSVFPLGTYMPPAPASGPTVSAPVPTEDPADVVSIYSDTYTDLTIASYDPDWGQPGNTLVNTTFDPTGSGTDFVLAYPNFTYQGTDFGSNEDLSGMDFLHVDIWVEAGTDRMVKVSPINNGSGAGEFLVEVPVTPGSWNSVTLDKADFTGMTWDSVFQLKFDGQFNGDGSANTTPFDIYLDNIYFSQTPASGPSNDDCDNAIALTVNPDDSCASVTSGTNVDSTASPQADDVTGTPDNDVWFSFVATGTSHTINIDNKQAIVGTSVDMGMGLYDGTGGCAGLTFFDDSDPDTLNATGLTLGTTYYVRVYGWYGSTSTLYSEVTFDICVGTPPPPPANDDCSGALPLAITTDNTTLTSFSTDLATEGPNELNDCDAFGNLGVWYTFTAPATNLEFEQGPNGDPGITIYEGPDCNNLTELTANCLNNNPGSITGLTVGNDYYAMVWTDSAQTTADFVLYFIDCQPPSALTANNVTTTSADLTWTSGDAETEWEVLWGPTGFDPATEGTLINDNDGTLGVNLSGLTEATTYDFYVTAVCGAGSTSPLVGPLTFTTPCDTIVAPFSEDFNTDPSTIPDCWSQGVANAEDWEFTDTPTGHIGDNGSFPNPSPSAGGFAWVDDSTPHNQDTRLESPFIDVSGLTIPALSFYFISDNEGDSNGNVDFRVEVWDGAAWNQVFFSNQNSVNEDWEEVVVDLSTLNITGDIQLAFIVDENNGTGFDDDLAIDDISVDEAPSCIKPTNLIVNNVTSDSADLSWNGTSTDANGYDYVLITDGSIPDDTTSPSGSVASGMSMESLTGLTPNTTYDVYVRTKCSGGDSDWSTVSTFTTQCLPFTAPYSENFDSASTPNIPGCWTTAGNSADEIETDDSHFGIDNPPSAPNFLKFGDVDLADGDEAILVSPQFSDLGSFDKRIRFKAAFEDGDVQSHNLYVGVMSDPTDASTFVEIAVVTSTLDETFSEFTVELTDSALIGSSQYIAIAAGSVASFDELAIDDFVYEEIPSCIVPENLAVSNVTLDSADLSWDAETTATGGYEYVLITDGSTPDDTTTPTGNVGSGVTNVNLTGLTDGTSYDAYVRSVCVDGVSVWSTVVSFATDCDTFSTFPYTETFEDTSSTLNCWSTTSSIGTREWEFGTDTNAAGSINGNGMAFFDDDAAGSGTDNNATLLSPVFDLSGMTSPQMVFDYHLRALSNGESLSVDVWDGAAWQNVLTYTNNDGLWSGSGSQVATIDISTYTNTDFQVRFVYDDGPSDFWGWYAGIDNFTIQEPPTATVQVIHNSADPSAEFVDVYLDGALLLDDFEFRNATAFVEVPAETPIDIDVAPSTSADVSESIYNLNTTLTADETYIVVANGVIDPTQFDASVNTIDFGLDVFAGAQQSSTNAGETSVLVNHGSPDAPTVDVREISVPAGIVVDDISYPEFQGYLDLATQDYQLSVELGDNSAVVASYEANLATLGTSDLAITVLASGFLDPSANQSGAAFGLWAALPTGGPLVELPEFTPPPANDNVCDAIELTVGAPSSGDAYTNESATAETNEPVPACFNGGINGSVWFTFVAPDSGEVSVTTDIEGATLTDTEVAVYDAPTDCADLTTFGAELGCNQDIGFPNFQSQVDLTGLTPGETYYIQVDQWGTATPGTFGIRVLDANPSCPVPANLSVSNIGESSATLNWDDVAEAANGYEWFVYTSPSDITTDTPVASGTVGAGVLTDDVTGLMPQTDYDFYVSSDCDVDDTSILSDPVTFTTDCSAFTPDYLEDFTNFVPDCWNEATDGDPTTGPTGFGSGDWAADGFLNNGSSGSARINLYNTGTSDWLLSPRFDLSAGGYELIFDVGITAFSGNGNSAMGSDDEVQLLYSDDNGATWNNLITWNAGNEPSNSGELAEVDLSAITGANVQFAFWATEGAVDDPEDYNIYVDNFEVRTPPTCPEPENLTVSNITLDSADLSWDEVVEASTGYNWSVYTSPSDPSTDTPVADGTVGTGVTTTQVTGLMPNSEYDFYLEADCGSTDGTSVLVGPVTFSTIPDFCGGDLFYDNGGPGADYANNSNETITISPSSASDVVTVSFTSFSTEFNYDGLLIYDGPDTSAPLIDSGYEAPGFSPLSDGAWTGDNTEGSNPEGLSFISTHPSGSLTFVFTSDVSFTEAGWEATVTCGPPPTPASVQIIHNSADPAAEFVDVYVNGVLTLDDFEFRTATPFVDLPADTFLNIDVAPSTSTDVSESIYNLNTTLTADESYIVVANGVLDPTQFDASANTIDFGLDVFAGAQQSSTVAGDTSLLVHHGSTDAPTIDAVETSVPVGTIVDDLAYSEFQGYLDVLTQDYVINIETADNSAVVESYEVPLQTLGLSDQAISVVASGFLDPVANQNGSAFGLWVALPAGGPLVELPVVTPEPMTPAPDPTEDPLNVISMFSGVYTDVPVDTWLTQWSFAQLADIQIQGNDTKLYTDLDFAGIETVANPIDASGMDFFHIDVWSPNATTFRVKLVDLGAGVEGEIAFDIAQEQWVSLEIPLNDFADPAIVTDPNNLLTSRSSLQQLIISGLPVGAVTAYVDNVYFSDDPSISTTNFDRNNFNFYPNPTRNLLNLETSSQVENVRIYNMLGQQVMEDAPKSVSPSLNVDSLQSGTYIMNVTIDGVSKNFKFVKE